VEDGRVRRVVELVFVTDILISLRSLGCVSLYIYISFKLG
jgi:hypothetical protein